MAEQGISLCNLLTTVTIIYIDIRNISKGVLNEYRLVSAAIYALAEADLI